MKTVANSQGRLWLTITSCCMKKKHARQTTAHPYIQWVRSSTSRSFFTPYSQTVTLGLYRNWSVERIKGNQATFDNSQRSNLRSFVRVFLFQSAFDAVSSFLNGRKLVQLYSFFRYHMVLLENPYFSSCPGDSVR